MREMLGEVREIHAIRVNVFQRCMLELADGTPESRSPGMERNDDDDDVRVPEGPTKLSHNSINRAGQGFAW